jgi:hypothetical protein
MEYEPPSDSSHEFQRCKENKVKQQAGIAIEAGKIRTPFERDGQ